MNITLKVWNYRIMIVFFYLLKLIVLQDIVYFKLAYKLFRLESYIFFSSIM